MLACRLWSAKIGQDFIPQCNLLGIDYCSIHLWPVNWNTYDVSFPTTWITAHEAATKSLNKPLVLEEVRCHVTVSCKFKSGWPLLSAWPQNAVQLTPTAQSTAA